MFTAEITHPASLYQSVITMLSSLNSRQLYRFFPAVRHTLANAEKHSYTPSHASPPTHSSLWWVWAPCHNSRVISTLLLYAYIAITHTLLWQKGFADWQIRSLGHRGGSWLESSGCDLVAQALNTRLNLPASSLHAACEASSQRHVFFSDAVKNQLNVFKL